MGVESGSDTSPVRKIGEGLSPPPRNLDISVFYWAFIKTLHIHFFLIKWLNSEEKIKFGTGGFGCPIPSRGQNFVAVPLF